MSRISVIALAIMRCLPARQGSAVASEASRSAATCTRRVRRRGQRRRDALRRPSTPPLCLVNAERATRGLPRPARVEHARERREGPQRRHGRAQVLLARQRQRRHRCCARIARTGYMRSAPLVAARRDDRLGPARSRRPPARGVVHGRAPRTARSCSTGASATSGVGLALGAPMRRRRRTAPRRSRSTSAVAERRRAVVAAIMRAMALCDDVRASCAQIAARRALGADRPRRARRASTRAPPPALDPRAPLPRGLRGRRRRRTCSRSTRSTSARAGFRRCASAQGCSGYFTVAWALADRFRAHGPWSHAELRALRADELADVARPAPRPRADGALRAGAARARPLPRRPRRARRSCARRAARRSAWPTLLAAGMALFDDRGFYKRAQIAAADLALAGVARFADLDRLTIFADNLVPHVLRCDGRARYDAGARGADRRRAAAAPGRPGARDPRLRRARVRAHRRRGGCRARELDNGCGTAGRRRSTRRGRGTAAARSTTDRHRTSMAQARSQVAGPAPRSLAENGNRLAKSISNSSRSSIARRIERSSSMIQWRRAGASGFALIAFSLLRRSTCVRIREHGRQ